MFGISKDHQLKIENEARELSSQLDFTQTHERIESFSKINQAPKVVISILHNEMQETKQLNNELSLICEKRNCAIDVFRCNFDPEKPDEVDTIVELFETANEEIKDILKL